MFYSNVVLPTLNSSVVTSIETSEVTENISLDDLVLRITMTIKTFIVHRKINFRTRKSERLLSKKLISTETKDLNLKLSEISLDKLSDFRNKKVPSFVLKINGSLYHTVIPNNISFFSSRLLGCHQCSYLNNVCSRLSNASDVNGGCEKVRNFSQYIENYPWILTGYETFNTNYDSLRVVNCLHYEDDTSVNFD